MEAVSFVVPVHNGARSIGDTIDAICAQADGRPIEVIVVDDHSSDGSSEILRTLEVTRPIRVLKGDGRGAAAAINIGIGAARFPIICQVDQDVVVRPGWMRLLLDELDDPGVAAAQGYYTTDPNAGLCARAMNVDLEQRYAAIDGSETDHVCTGNAAYRAEAIRRVGLFSEKFGYGYDNDMSYRLRAAGYRLRLCRRALSVHRWREGLSGYLAQQYGFGYGRIDLVAKYPGRASGDAVSPAGMMAHPVLMLLAVLAGVGAVIERMRGAPWQALAMVGLTIVTALAMERLAAGISAARRFRDAAPLLFPVLHLARDLAWVAAIATWTARRVLGRSALPSHSMRRSDPSSIRLKPDSTKAPNPSESVLCLIPAHNERGNLPAVIEEVRSHHPLLDILVVDDGSTDGTEAWLSASRDVRYLRLPERMGIGSAMRAGLRYAARLGYDAVVRLDGDGQHRADEIDQLLGPINRGDADVVLGSRYVGLDAEPTVAQRVLARCLSAMTRRRVTDATSGFYSVGPRALRLLAEHHPTGYPEPELRLFLNRNGLTVVEVPVRARQRFGGRTSLTAGRLTAAGARVMLALIVEPFRGRIGDRSGD